MATIFPQSWQRSWLQKYLVYIKGHSESRMITQSGFDVRTILEKQTLPAIWPASIRFILFIRGYPATRIIGSALTATDTYLVRVAYTAPAGHENAL